MFFRPLYTALAFLWLSPIVLSRPQQQQPSGADNPAQNQKQAEDLVDLGDGFDAPTTRCAVQPPRDAIRIMTNIAEAGVGVRLITLLLLFLTTSHQSSLTDHRFLPATPIGRNRAKHWIPMLRRFRRPERPLGPW